MTDLFSQKPAAPLAELLRPQTLDDVVGQKHLVGAKGALRLAVAAKKLPSMILWGPPGCGKTTLAKILALVSGDQFLVLSATSAGVKEIRECVEMAQRQLDMQNRKTVLFLDEIHRLNKSQQDALLPHVESGLITLIGATTVL